MEIKLDNEYIFIPNWNENKQETEENQIKVFWQYPNAKDINDAIKTKFIGQSSETVMDWDSLVNKCVKKIDNLKVNNDKIESIIKLYESDGLGGLYSEIKTVIIKSVEGIQKKTSR